MYKVGDDVNYFSYSKGDQNALRKIRITEICPYHDGTCCDFYSENPCVKAGDKFLTAEYMIIVGKERKFCWIDDPKINWCSKWTS